MLQLAKVDEKATWEYLGEMILEKKDVLWNEFGILRIMHRFVKEKRELCHAWLHSDLYVSYIIFEHVKFVCKIIFRNIHLCRLFYNTVTCKQLICSYLIKTSNTMHLNKLFNANNKTLSCTVYNHWSNKIAIMCMSRKIINKWLFLLKQMHVLPSSSVALLSRNCMTV